MIVRLRPSAKTAPPPLSVQRVMAMRRVSALQWLLENLTWSEPEKAELLRKRELAVERSMSLSDLEAGA